MTPEQAKSFAEKIIGSELCTGAGEDQASTYFISPVPRAFLEGAIGAKNLPPYFASHVKPERYRKLAEYFIEVGKALLREDGET